MFKFHNHVSDIAAQSGITGRSFTVGHFSLTDKNHCHGKHFNLIKIKNTKSRGGLRVKANKNFPLCGLNDGKKMC